MCRVLFLVKEGLGQNDGPEAAVVFFMANNDVSFGFEHEAKLKSITFWGGHIDEI